MPGWGADAILLESAVPIDFPELERRYARRVFWALRLGVGTRGERMRRSRGRADGQVGRGRGRGMRNGVGRTMADEKWDILMALSDPDGWRGGGDNAVD